MINGVVQIALSAIQGTVTDNTSDTPTPPSVTGVWAYVVAIVPVIALILTPILGWLVSRKKGRASQEQNLITEVQEERNEMKKQRDEAVANAKQIEALLRVAEGRVREFEEMMVKARIEKMEITAELVDSRRINQEMVRQLAAFTAATDGITHEEKGS